MAGRAASSTPVPTTETADTSGDAASTVTELEWKAMQTVLSNIYAYRTEEWVLRCRYPGFN